MTGNKTFKWQTQSFMHTFNSTGIFAKHFNVSTWNDYSIKKKEHKLEELIEMVEDDEMPLKSYTIIHGNLSEDDKKILLQWAGVARLQYKHQLEVSSNK